MKEYFELNTKTVIQYVRANLEYFSSDASIVCHEIGDGNLNLVFRLEDEKENKSVIVKQALPYVRVAGAAWPLDIGRGAIESKLLKLEYELTDGLVPEVYFYDKVMCCMIMEDLKDYVIMRTGLLDFIQYPDFAGHITDFMVKTLLLTSDVVLDHQEKKAMVGEYINPELCDITECLVYTEPFGTYDRNSMEAFLTDFAKENLENDIELKLEVAKLKFDFMNNAQALIHGDLHTGSIFVNQKSTRVIDPEFAFYGPMAYDIGALVANLIMNYLSTQARLEEGELRERHCKWLIETIEKCIDLFADKFLALWHEAVKDDMAKTPGFAEWYLKDVLINTAGVAGCEMVRRTVGFAHVKDLDKIPDAAKRENAKKTNLLMAKELIKNRHGITKGSDYTTVIMKYNEGAHNG